jgi:diguanylate cyclase (GGDEF)-like protein
MDTMQFKDREFGNFQITALKILTRLTLQENIDDMIIEHLRELGLEYDSVMKKYEMSNIDYKTSLLKYNEDFLVNIVKTISRYWQGSQKTHVIPISYIRVDLDDFSKINNRYGHDAGDLVLAKVAETLKKAVRPTDYVFRFGGEEFDIVLPVTPLEGAAVFIDRAIKAIRKIDLTINTCEKIGVTASMGLSYFEIDFSYLKKIMPDEIILLYRRAQKQADCACYQAKFNGKDRYRVYDSEADYSTIMREYSSRN